jgi:molybdenum cofactor cytidylyltransferase
MICGAILAAGAARRFGAVKQLADFHGRPLLAHAVSAMCAVEAVEDVVVVLGAAADEIERAVPLGRARVVRCADWAEGRSASLRTAVEAARERDADALVVTLGDAPLVTPAAISRVLDAADAIRLARSAPPAPAVQPVRAAGPARGARAVRPTRAVYRGVPGHPVLLPRDLFAAVAALRGETGASALLAASSAREVECGDVASADDVDTPADLRALARPVRRRPGVSTR